MLDLEGNELEVGVIYLLPGDESRLVLAEYSHETEANYIFNGIRYEHNIGCSAKIYSWKRQVPKDVRFTSITALKASDELIRRYIQS